MRKKDRERKKIYYSGKHYAVFLFTGCWHFLFRAAAGYLWKTGPREDFYALYDALFLETDMLRGKADASRVIGSKHR